MQQHHILITGGSGILGQQLTQSLLNKGYQVNHLSRKLGKHPQVKTFLWNVEQQQIDENCLQGIDTIVHLAGAGVADKRWTKKRKQQIIDSRTQSIRLIYQLMQRVPHQVKQVISASATGYYGDQSDELLVESSPAAHDFLGTCCMAWEKAVDEGQQLGLSITKFRTGVVLTQQGGALPQLARPIKFGVGAALGNGRQWIPWIHIQDAVNMYLEAIEGSLLPDVYNMVAPTPATNQQLTIAVAKQLRKPLWLPNVPAFLLKLLFGKMSTVVLGSTRVSAEKVQQAGFTFTYNNLTDALKNIYG
ncbi:TIGR01777 family protein [Mucilaginibacter robiniae]|uniref:TIGR01777 family protein n=1 Tax=Mucilaginibacter robiniae TaxID=2728022 RepID=A0A7L5DZQ8_9SPHI|nr:TIGR01777 family oxidoreductase [Mucilaginibacter robiniae]QJD95519.1 TIGR01777 family protein [Mucilaginibacter robiniae]